MRTTVRKTMQLRELIVAAFDKAAQFTADAREISRPATGAVIHMRRRARGGHRSFRSPVTALARTNAQQGR